MWEQIYVWKQRDSVLGFTVNDTIKNSILILYVDQYARPLWKQQRKSKKLGILVPNKLFHMDNSHITSLQNHSLV